MNEFQKKNKTYLAMAIGFVLNYATRCKFSAFIKGNINGIFCFINGDIYNSPPIGT